MTGKRRRVVVLGGTGFLGRHLRAAFRAKGDHVVCVSRTLPGRLAGTDADEHFVALDLLTASHQELRSLLTGADPDIVVNAAGAVWKVTEKQMMAANAELVTTLIAALREMPHRPWLLQLGSVHEYGAGTRDSGLAENGVEAPVTPYGRSKLAASRSVLDAADSGALDGVVLRMANIVGPGVPAGSLLGDVAAHLERYAENPGAIDAELVCPPLRAERDFVDLRDVVDAVVAAAGATRAEVCGRVINVGSGRAVRAGEVVERLLALSGLPVRLVERPAAGGADGVDCQKLDISRARRLLGWEPCRDLDAALLGLLSGLSLV
ncbi:NAD(P)-dependent oxidoreductase [Streptomyces laculatispora]|uniref:NAD(P)-dependent oxidoreductase n=1 Tax=Streptomyces laculatispora TaxID=887464 RepID=A0ABY9I3B4_9ACTN|nr:NAD(P)-dependent oxidoreductase [Streptomyces laculatispora]WLQ40111.1 NAD(P)-dependent oxidoreductase [Streptomyces laculatispora]